MMELLGNEVEKNGGKISLCEDAVHPQDMLREVHECDVLIGMRLHSLIYAAGQRVPLIGISYDPKIDHFLKRIHCAPVGATNTLDSRKLASEIQQLLNQGDEWREEREPLISTLVQMAEAPAKQIAQYLSHKG